MPIKGDSPLLPLNPERELIPPTKDGNVVALVWLKPPLIKAMVVPPFGVWSEYRRNERA